MRLRLVFYDRGLRKDLAYKIQELDPYTKYHEGYLPADLKKELSRLGIKNTNEKRYMSDTSKRTIRR